ncbi:MAG: hypothetical protein ABW061_04025 [Polyangiaceae bacterium]
MNERKQRWLSSGFPNHNLHPAAKLLGRLFVLEPNAGRIHSMNTDGSNKKTIVNDCRNCDGIVVDVEAGQGIGPTLRTLFPKASC